MRFAVPVARDQHAACLFETFLEQIVSRCRTGKREGALDLAHRDAQHIGDILGGHRAVGEKTVEIGDGTFQQLGTGHFGVNR